MNVKRFANTVAVMWIGLTLAALAPMLLVYWAFGAANHFPKLPHFDEPKTTTLVCPENHLLVYLYQRWHQRLVPETDRFKDNRTTFQYSNGEPLVRQPVCIPGVLPIEVTK